MSISAGRSFHRPDPGPGRLVVVTATRCHRRPLGIALHCAKWINDRAPAELLYHYRRPPAGVRTWSDRLADEEVQLIAGMPATNPARTALDLACRYPVGQSVAAIDALAHVTDLKIADVELLTERYKGRRASDVPVVP